MTDSTTRSGSTFGHYQIRELLGRGGMGEVYEAYDTEKDRVVALKILSGQYYNNESFRERFRRESRAAAQLQEPHVIPIHDWGDVDGTLYIDMRRVNGVDLGTVLKNGPLDPPSAVAIIGQVAAALDAAHAAGLVHRDVKPENIIVTPADFAYLVDFGIAETADDTRLTAIGTAIGSFAYMAPERFGDGEITPAADVYSLACVLHEMLVGSTPYPSTSVQQLITAHISAPPPRTSTINPAVPVSFDEVIGRGMAKDADDRYGSAGAFARAAQRALRSSESSAATAVAPASYPPPARYSPPASWPPNVFQQQAGPGSRRRTWVIPVAIMGAVVLMAALGVTLLVLSRGNGRVEAELATPTVAAGVTVPPPSRQPAVPPTPAIALPSSARACPAFFGPSGAFTKSAAGTPVTSCEFAESVRQEYGRSGPPSPTPRVINAYSPVTSRSYPMTCVANVTLATCTGGENAVVYVY